MAEFANYQGARIQIGTCENMYYLRADQRFKVRAVHGSVDPVRDAEALRFRFPWPDEDDAAPGDFDKPDRSASLWCVAVPKGVEHGSVQFVAPVGYLVSLPCPEACVTTPYTVHRNGFAGPVRIVQQRIRGDRALLVCACGGCGVKFHLPEWDDVAPYVEACEREASRRDTHHAAWWTEVRARIVRGYGKE